MQLSCAVLISEINHKIVPMNIKLNEFRNLTFSILIMNPIEDVSKEWSH